MKKDAGRHKSWFVIIMAGGRGERFWPVSREKTPKQLIKLLGSRSFLQAAVDNVSALVPVQNIVVITNRAQAPEVKRQLPRLPKPNIIAEPCGRDTTAAVTLGAALVGQRDPNGVMAVLPADHVIPEPKRFQQVLGDALELASRDKVIVTIGIKPTEPATGYGYIRMGDRLEAPAGIAPFRTIFHRAERFVEKPNQDRALEYMNSGRYRWNAGMFVWSFETIREGLNKHRPEMAGACQRWLDAAAKGRLQKAIMEDYPTIEKVSIDYALMEKAENVVVADGTFSWDDLGSWSALMRHLKPDAEGNCAMGDFIHLDAARNLIYDARTRHRTVIAVVGLRDTIIVQTDDAVLLAHNSQAQRVKELVRKLAKSGRHRRLV